jgi:hypothetical protein
MTAGSNDYCSVPTTTDAYAGFYFSTDGGPARPGSVYVCWTRFTASPRQQRRVLLALD